MTKRAKKLGLININIFFVFLDLSNILTMDRIIYSKIFPQPWVTQVTPFFMSGKNRCVKFEEEQQNCDSVMVGTLQYPLHPVNGV